jgi:AcrR family transcriptional regulator
MFQSDEHGVWSEHQTRGAATRQRLLAATARVLGRVGPARTTIRRIAAEAGVNVAAINYHFGSKERLVEEALGASAREAFPTALIALERAIAHHGMDVRRGLTAFLADYLAEHPAFPRLTPAHLHRALTEQVYDDPAIRDATDFLVAFTEVVGPAMPLRDEADRRAAVAHFWATVLFQSLLPHLFDGFAVEPLTSERGRSRLVARLVEQLLGP